MMLPYYGPPPPAGGRELAEVAVPVLLAGAMSLGANLAAVRSGRMSPGLAVCDAALKGALATAIWRASTPGSPGGRLTTLALLLSAGYAVGTLLSEAGPSPENRGIQRT